MTRTADEKLRALALLDAARRPKRERGAVSATINVTPLVDVVLVLLIIFMVVTPLLAGKIELPKVLEPLPWTVGESDLRVGLTEQGELRIDQSVVSLEGLARQLQREVSQRPGRPIFFEADRALPFASVRPVLKALRDAGAHHVGLAANPLRPGDEGN